MGTKSDGSFFGKIGSFEKNFLFDALVFENGTQYKPPLPEALEIVKECSEGAKDLLRIAKKYGEQKFALTIHPLI